MCYDTDKAKFEREARKAEPAPPSALAKSLQRLVQGMIKGPPPIIVETKPPPRVVVPTIKMTPKYKQRDRRSR